MGTHPIFESDFDCLTEKQDIMADKTVDLGILEEDDEFEEFPAEDWKEVTDTDPKSDAVWNAIGKMRITSTTSTNNSEPSWRQRETNSPQLLTPNQSRKSSQTCPTVVFSIICPHCQFY